mgnify:CR=1 FL=1
MESAKKRRISSDFAIPADLLGALAQGPALN